MNDVSWALPVLSLWLIPQVPTEALSADWSKVAAASPRAQAERHPRRWDGEATCEEWDCSLPTFSKALINCAAKNQRVKGLWRTSAGLAEGVYSLIFCVRVYCYTVIILFFSFVVLVIEILFLILKNKCKKCKFEHIYIIELLKV